MTFAELLHGFFNFLGYPPGELLKSSVELIFFTIITYMVTSEWTRSRKKELKFLILAFGALTINKLISTYFLAGHVFTDGIAYFHTLAMLDNFMEIFALFLVANAFVYPIMRQKKLRAKKFMADHFILVTIVSFVFSIFTLSIIDLNGGSLEHFWTNTSANVAQVIVLLYYAGYILVNEKYFLKYKTNIFTAFVIYSITPVLNLFNIILYDNMNRSLTVAAYPFPLFSMLIFTQVIYLKLVDKATILDRLRKSQQLYEQEKEVSKLKDEFISTVSHELKTPLTSMKLYVGLLKEKKLGKLVKKQKDALVVIDEETDRLNQLITDLLDLSRLKSKKNKMNLSEFDLGKLLNDKICMGLAKRGKIDVVVDVPQGMMVTADRAKMKQVLINLFNNAVKFTPPKGNITIRAAMLETEWEFSVADTGKGIPKDQIPRLFEKFYQVDDYMTREQGGIGLGLAIVKQIVDLHKGKISVESEPGKGTKFTLMFPRLSMY